MRDIVAGGIAIVLLLAAASLATNLQILRRRRQRGRDGERALGRAIVAELPAGEDLVLFSEDDARFYYGERSIDKALIVAARLLVNGTPVAVSPNHAARADPAREVPATLVAIGDGREGQADQPDGILRDRWDVTIETVTGEVRIECGAIRERVSQELARAIFHAVRRDLESRDG